jgi:hypothetical protein
MNLASSQATRNGSSRNHAATLLAVHARVRRRDTEDPNRTRLWLSSTSLRIGGGETWSMQTCANRNNRRVNKSAAKCSHNGAVTCLAGSMGHGGVGVSLLLLSTPQAHRELSHTSISTITTLAIAALLRQSQDRD